MTLSPHSHVVLDDKGNAYASQDIQPGAEVEIAPCIIVPARGRLSAFRTESPIYKAAYVWNPETDEIGLGMGLLALYGYSLDPNTVVEPDHQNRVLRAKAVRLIRSGEHLTRIQQFNGHEDETEPLPPLSIDAVKTHPVEVRKSKWGLGVFATEDIPADGIVENCPVTLIGPEDRFKAARLGLKNYVYSWQKNGKGVPETVGMALGYGGIYNHSSSDDNITFRYDFEGERIEFFARRDIAKGSELFHNYGWGDGDKRLR